MSHMTRALSLAGRAVGYVSPNPPVGAVVVKDGVVVGEGWTQPPGREHAEIVALRQAGPEAAGAVLYTTLEPCSHFGRTAPCADAIIDAGVKVVSAAVLDPNPLVSGRGLARLTESGVSATVGEGGDEARKLIEAYTGFITTGLPYVTAKFAMSLDGKIATRTGDSKWITGEEARRYANGLRAETDAVMVGINTVLADDPRLTARGPDDSALDRQPLRVVVDSGGRFPEGAAMLGQPGENLVAATTIDRAVGDRLTRAGAAVETLPAEDGSVDLARLMRHLGGERNVVSLLVEGGGTLLGSLFDLGLVDKVVAFIAPLVIGGREAPGPVQGLGAGSVAEALRLDRAEVLRLGHDLAVVGYCRRPTSG